MHYVIPLINDGTTLTPHVIKIFALLKSTLTVPNKVELIQQVKKKYEEVGFLFELLGLKLPMVELLYSHGRLIHIYDDPWELKIEAWYKGWFDKFQAAKQLQEAMDISINQPEIYVQTYNTHKQVFSGSKSLSQGEELLRCLHNHHFRDLIIFHYELDYFACVQSSRNDKHTLELIEKLLEKGKREPNLLSYLAARRHCGEDATLFHFYLIGAKIQTLHFLGQIEEAKELLMKITNDFAVYRKENRTNLLEEDQEFLDEIEINIMFLEISQFPEEIDGLIFRIVKEERLQKHKNFQTLILAISNNLGTVVPDRFNYLARLLIKNWEEFAPSVDALKILNKIAYYYLRHPVDHPELFSSILQLTKRVVRHHNFTLYNNLDQIVGLFERLTELDVREPFYQAGFIEWQQRRLDSFIIERMAKVYEEQSYRDIFKIYLNFFQKYKSDVPVDIRTDSDQLNKIKSQINQHIKKGSKIPLSRCCLKYLKETGNVPLIKNGKMEDTMWTVANLLSDSIQYLEPEEKEEAKKVLNELFSHGVIAEFLQLVEALPSVPEDIKQVVGRLIASHSKYAHLIRTD